MSCASNQCIVYITVIKQHNEKMYTTRTSIFTYLTLIPSCVGGAGEDPPTYKRGTFFLMPSALSVSIFNKKSHRTRVMETFEFLPKFESFHSPCLMRFFLENWHTQSQGHKKSCSHFTLRRDFPCPSHLAGDLGSFTP